MRVRRTGLVGLTLAGLLGLAAVAAPAGAAAAPAPSDTGSSVFGESRVVKAPAAVGKGSARTSDFDASCDFGFNGFGDFCIYSSGSRTGSVAAFSTDVPNLFLTRFPGTDISVGGNAFSGANEDASRYVIVWTHPNYTGIAGPIAPGESGDFCLPFFKNLGSMKLV